MNKAIDWIGVDWGTTHLRVYGLNDEQQVVCQSQSTQGMGSLHPEDFEPALLDLVHSWLPDNSRTLILACGMVGARQGWRESPYAVVPCSPGAPVALTLVATEDARLDVRIIAGLSQASPADVMRGEETQLLGLMASAEHAPNIVCLPGTHSKWVRLQGALVHRFQTYMTGEFFSLLTQYSVLRHSIASNEWDEHVFTEAVIEALDRPQDLLNASFGIRAGSLLENTTPARARSRLSGLLIGCELASAQPYWQKQSVALIGAEELAKRYAVALDAVGVKTSICDPDAMTLSGLRQVYLQHKSQHSGVQHV